MAPDRANAESDGHGTAQGDDEAAAGDGIGGRQRHGRRRSQRKHSAVHDGIDDRRVPERHGLCVCRSGTRLERSREALHRVSAAVHRTDPASREVARA